MSSGGVYYLYYDDRIRATYILLDYVVETVATWHKMPDYRKEGRLLYLSQLDSNLGTLRAAKKFDRLSRSQLKELRNLERLAVQANGAIKILQNDYEASKRRQADEDEK